MRWVVGFMLMVVVAVVSYVVLFDVWNWVSENIGEVWLVGPFILGGGAMLLVVAKLRPTQNASVVDDPNKSAQQPPREQ